MERIARLKKKLWRGLAIFILGLLASCAPLASEYGVTPSVIDETLTPTALPIRTSSLYPSIIIQTDNQTTQVDKMVANHTFNQQVTDGKLMLFAEEVNPECHKITTLETYMNVRLVFQNMTEDSLTIPDASSVSPNSRLTGGDIVALFFSTDGSRIRLWRDDLDMVMKYEPGAVVVIPAQNEYVITIKIPLPSTLSGYERITLIPPGHYLTKIIYNNSHDTVAGQGNIWTGIISSNLVELCMVE